MSALLYSFLAVNRGMRAAALSFKLHLGCWVEDTAVVILRSRSITLREGT